jgi:hypothetical protein
MVKISGLSFWQGLLEEVLELVSISYRRNYNAKICFFKVNVEKKNMLDFIDFTHKNPFGETIPLM